MKHLSLMLVALGALFVCAGCSDGPKDVAVKWSQSIMHGDAPDAALYSVSALQATNTKLTRPKLKGEAEKTVDMHRRIDAAIAALKVSGAEVSLAAVVRSVLTGFSDDEESVKKQSAAIQKQIGETIAKLKKAKAVVNGDVAVITPEDEESFRLRKIDGAWKVEKPSMTAFELRKKDAAKTAGAAAKSAGAKVDAAAKEAAAKTGAAAKIAGAKVDAALKK